MGLRLSGADRAHAGHARTRSASRSARSSRPVYRIRREIPRADDPRPVFRQSVEDRHWHALYLPIARCAEFLSGQIGRLQQGRISMYLLYSFLTLIALLVFAQ